MIEPFPFIEIAGTPYDRGVAYGKAAAGRMRKSVSLYAGQLAELGLEPRRIEAIIRSFMPKVGAFDMDYVAEMNGIARGADLSFEEVAIINLRTELLQIARKLARETPKDDDGCTGAVMLAPATADGSVIHGQNWDWRHECVETGVVLLIHRDDGPDVLVFTEAGGLARNGMNSVGTALTGNFLVSHLDNEGLGVPLPFIHRKALEEEHFAMALRAVATTPTAGSNNVMMSHADGFGIDFECAPDESFPIYPDQGLLVHANRWESPVAQTKLKDAGDSPSSFYRSWRLKELLARRHGQLTVDDLKTALFDRFGWPHSICRPPLPDAKSNLSGSVAMVIMQPARGIMEMAPLPAENRTFTTYRVTMESDASSRGPSA
jgi:isopenicillin-N N-acyltransferase like protein